MIKLLGIGISPGIAIGKAYVYIKQDNIVPCYFLKDEDIDGEILRFYEGIEEAKRELAKIKEKSSLLYKGYADIFIAHIMLLDDVELRDEIEQKIREEKKNAECIIKQVSDKLVNELLSIEDEIIRERAIDLRDISNRNTEIEEIAQQVLNDIAMDTGMFKKIVGFTVHADKTIYDFYKHLVHFSHTKIKTQHQQNYFLKFLMNIKTLIASSAIILSVTACTQETQNQLGRALNNWTGTDGILEVYAGNTLVKRFMKIDKLTTAAGTSNSSDRPYRYGYGYLDANLNGKVDKGEKKVYFEFSDYSTSYIFFENPA